MCILTEGEAKHSYQKLIVDSSFYFQMMMEELQLPVRVTEILPLWALAFCVELFGRAAFFGPAWWVNVNTSSNLKKKRFIKTQLFPDEGCCSTCPHTCRPGHFISFEILLIPMGVVSVRTNQVTYPHFTLAF